MLKTKKNILKVLAVMMMLLLSLTVLAGCGKEESTTNNEENTENKEETKTISQGKWEGNTFTSEFSGLKFNLPEGWTRSTDEEIAEVMQLGKEVLEDEGLYSSKLSELNMVYDMMAKNDATNGSVAVLMEKQSASEDEYMEALKTQLGSVTQINYNIADITDTVISGDTYKTLQATAEVSGTTIYQNYYIRREGDYMVEILATETSEEAINTIMNSFE